jgi:DNA-binding GntR family transcriptional regulator
MNTKERAVTTFKTGTVTRSTLRESVAARVRAAILEGDIPGGTHLAEVGLSESLGVSRATLREALRQLQEEGVAVQDSRGRVSVRSISAKEVHDLYEVRLGLELIAVRRLCELPAAERRLDDLRAKLERLRQQVSLAADLDADLEFHGMVCSAAQSPILYKSWQNISSLIRLTMVAAGPDSARENMAFERHAPIVDLIAKGDADEACRFLESHMLTAERVLVERMNAPEKVPAVP